MLLYAYVSGNPLVMIDPLGLTGFFEWLGLGNNQSAPGFSANGWNYIDAAVGGYYSGLWDGGKITANSLTGGFIAPLDQHVDNLVAENGTAYAVANTSSQVGALVVDVASGKELLNLGAKGFKEAVEAGIKIAGREGDAAIATASVVVKTEQAVVAGAEVAGGVGALTLGAGNVKDLIEDHHGLPRQFEKWFNDHGIDNIDDYKIPLEQGKHRLKPDGIHTNDGGNWNKTWKDWTDANPNATPEEIINQLNTMIGDFKLGCEKFTFGG